MIAYRLVFQHQPQLLVITTATLAILSAVREAIMWEVAFSPTACRNQPMHGLVLLSLADGNTRFAIGSGAWRWSDLLGLRGIPPNR